jgi:rhodanese-related sulfurtransferase
MTKDELKGLLGGAELVVIDVRTAGDWQGSTEKIAGAIREEPGAEAAWAANYPKEKTLVLYCA